MERASPKSPASLDTATDEQLAQWAAREGSDGPAFAAIVQRYERRVWSICFRLVGNESDAHDAAQEVFVRLFLQREKFRGESKYSTWVHGIAVNVCLMQRRAGGRRRRREGAPTALDLDTQSTRRPAPSGDEKLDLLQMLELLDEEDRALILLKYAEGYEYEELSEIFQLSVSACKMRISRAREKIQNRYGEKKP